MDAAVAALIGAGIGAVVPATVTLVSARGGRDESREARLFEHRREAYTAFIQEANALASRMNDHYYYDDGEPPPAKEDGVRQVIDLYNLVALYGTEASAALAEEAWSRLAKLVREGKDKTNPNVFDFQVAMTAFITQARLDLGVKP